MGKQKWRTDYRRKRQAKLNPRAHRFIRMIHAEQHRRGMVMQELADASGVCYGTIQSWYKNGNTPRVDLIEAVFGVFGWSIGRVLGPPNALHTVGQGPMARSLSDPGE